MPVSAIGVEHRIPYLTIKELEDGPWDVLLAEGQRLLRAYPYHPDKAELLLNLATLHFYRGELDDALRICASDNFEPNIKIQVLLLKFNISRVKEIGDPRAFLTEAEALYQYNLLDDVVLLAQILFAKSTLNRCLETCLEARKIFEPYCQRQDVAKTHILEAEIEFEQGNNNSCMLILFNILDTSSLTPKLELQVLYLKARCYLTQHDYAQARNTIRDGLDKSLTLGAMLDYFRFAELNKRDWNILPPKPNLLNTVKALAKHYFPRFL